MMRKWAGYKSIRTKRLQMAHRRILRWTSHTSNRKYIFTVSPSITSFVRKTQQLSLTITIQTRNLQNISPQIIIRSWKLSPSITPRHSLHMTWNKNNQSLHQKTPFSSFRNQSWLKISLTPHSKTHEARSMVVLLITPITLVRSTGAIQKANSARRKECWHSHKRNRTQRTLRSKTLSNSLKTYHR